MNHAEFSAAIAARIDEHLTGLTRFTADASHPEVAALARQTSAVIRQTIGTLLLAFSEGPDAFASPAVELVEAAPPAAVPPTEPPAAP